MYSSLKTLIVLLVLSLAVSGCGDLLGSKVVKRELDTSTITNLTCELDVNKFSEIMNEVIESQIRCLGESLNVFIRIVKSGKPGYLSLVQLEKYLATKPEIKPEVVRALKSVFDLGHLITGEEPGYISKATVDKVIEFAVTFNREAAKNFQPIFRDTRPVSYIRHLSNRAQISEASKAILNKLGPIFNRDRGNQIHKINIISLLESFSTETNREHIDKAKKILFLKKVLFGGENEVLTHQELDRLIQHFNILIQIGLDIVRYKHILLEQKSILDLLKFDVDALYKVITYDVLDNRDGELLFTINEAIEAAKLFFDEDDFDIEKFRNLIGEGKKIVMKGNATEVRGIELKNLFGHAQSVLQTGTIFHRIWDTLSAELIRTDDVRPDLFDDYRNNYPKHDKEVNQFERIARKYRFFKGEFLAPLYIRGSKRNAPAFFEIALFEYAIQLVFSAYGVPSPNQDAVGGYSIDKLKMQQLVMRFRNELFELDLITPGREIGTADNISLLGTLFQYQSDKNGFMDVNEATEFGVALFSSLNISDDMHAYMVEKGCKADDFNRLEPACFKEHFWDALRKYYSANFPLLYKFIDENKGSGNSGANGIFLQKAINAARSCNFYTDGAKEEIFYSKGDFMSILLALMHAETTVIRWDKNGNNIMDASEVMDAYEIYSPALDGFLEGKPGIIKSLKKQIYQYMIKYEQVPNEKEFSSIWKFVKFLLSFNKKAPATRKTIVALLDVIGQENAKLQTGPQFDCNLLRNPDEIKPAPALAMKPMALKTETVSPSKTLKWTAEKLVALHPQELEIIKDEMFIFSGEMSLGGLSDINSVRQENLKTLFREISRNRTEMGRIRSLVTDGSDLHKIAFAVSLILTEME